MDFCLFVYFVPIFPTLIQHHRTHSGLLPLSIVPSFSDQEKPGSHCLQFRYCTYLFNPGVRVVSELLILTKNKILTRIQCFCIVLFVFSLNDSSQNILQSYLGQPFLLSSWWVHLRIFKAFPHLALPLVVSLLFCEGRGSHDSWRLDWLPHITSSVGSMIRTWGLGLCWTTLPFLEMLFAWCVWAAERAVTQIVWPKQRVECGWTACIFLGQAESSDVRGKGGSLEITWLNLLPLQMGKQRLRGDVTCPRWASWLEP